MLTTGFSVRSGGLKSKTGLILGEKERVKARWKDYTESIYEKDKRVVVELCIPGQDMEPNVLDSEVRSALKEISNGKSAGPDNIPIELLKAAEEDGIRAITTLCQKIWTTCEWPEDWKKLTYVLLLKKGTQENVRTIGQSH